MKKPSDIPASVWEFADIAMDELRTVSDDREFLARAVLAWDAKKAPAIGLTQRQAGTLQFIKEYIAKNGSSPTYREIATDMGMVVNSAHSLVHQLKERGAIAQLPRRARSIVILDGAVA